MFQGQIVACNSNSKPFGQGQNSVGRRRNALERTTAKINEPVCGNNMLRLLTASTQLEFIIK
jgi:hypothetical protein